jgi:hypothetical protein
VSNTWNDVPDPRDGRDLTCDTCQVKAEERVWRHIAEGHASNPEEPWDEWLTPTGLADRFRGQWQLGSTDEDRQATLAEVSVIVEGEAKECLRVPLAVLYDESPPPEGSKPSKWHEAWSLVLPAGALLVIESRPTGGAMQSCYFKKRVCRQKNPTARWRVLVQLLTLTYAERQADGCWRAREIFSRGDYTVVRIRFCHEASWSLDQNHPDPWELIVDPFHPPPAAPLGLVPRRSC